MLIDCINDRIKLTEVPLWLTVRKLVRVGVWVRSKLTVSGRLRHQLPTNTRCQVPSVMGPVRIGWLSIHI